MIRIETSRRDDLLDFDHARLAAHRHHRVEVPRGLAKYEVAAFVRLPRFHQREVGADAALKHIELTIKLHRRLAVGDDRSDARLGVEARDASTACTHTLGEGALRIELKFELACHVLALKLSVLANITRHHLLDLPRLEQKPQSPFIHSRVVAHGGEPFHARIAQGDDELLRNPAQAKPSDRDSDAVASKTVERGGWRVINLAVHGRRV